MKCNSEPYEGHEKYVFVSYCHENESEVYPYIEALANQGYRVWFDEGINPGVDWPETIAEHLDNSSAVIAFVSKESINSHNCRREINYAVLKKKDMLICFIDETKLTPGMEMIIATLQAIKLYEHNFDENCKSITKFRPLRFCFEKKERQGFFNKLRHLDDINFAKDGFSHENNDDKVVNRIEEKATGVSITEEEQNKEMVNRPYHSEGETPKASSLDNDKNDRIEPLSEEAVPSSSSHNNDEIINIACSKEENIKGEALKAEEHIVCPPIEKVNVLKQEDISRLVPESNPIMDDAVVLEEGYDYYECEMTIVEPAPVVEQINDGTVSIGGIIGNKERTQVVIPRVLYRVETGQHYEIIEQETIVGRGEKATIRFDKSKTLSRIHFTIRTIGDAHYIVDNHSLNKVYLNGLLLEPGKEYKLCFNDVIVAGAEVFVYENYSCAGHSVFVVSKCGIDTQIESNGIIRIGRNENCNDIAFNSKYVSYHHAIITSLGHLHWIIDLDSLNGTYVNGERIPAYKRIKINNTAAIRFGMAEIAFADCNTNTAF